MSCENSPNRVGRLGSRFSAGIGQLTSKRGFYAGLALGGLGLLGAGLVSLARRATDSKQNPSQMKGLSPMINLKQIPQLPTRTKIAPTTSRSATEQCSECQASAQSKQGPWYAINGQAYCQDCAPDAARKADVDLVAPLKPAANGTQGQRTGQVGANNFSQTPSPPRSSVQTSYLPPERRVETRLVESRIGLNLGDAGNPAPFVVDKGYVMLRPDGRGTGLALTPNLKAEQGADGQAQIREDTSQWWLTHISSGRAVTNQPYNSLEQAHLLGNILAQLDWTRDETDFTSDEYRRAGATVDLFNQSLAEAKQGAGSPIRRDTRPTATQTAPADSTRTRRLPDYESLQGKLVADGYGGVSRVIEDNGDQLFLIDSLGKRYEVYRNEARTPDESDFEMCRVAMPVDPAKHQEVSCGTCQRSGQEAEATWYKMGWQSFCGSCATEYAANEGYIKAEEIDENMESLI